MKALLAVLLLSFVCFAKASITYEYQMTQLNNSQCVEIEYNKCTPCGSLYYLLETGGYAIAYTNIACTSFWGYAYPYYETCSSEYFYSDCQLFMVPTAINGYSLTLDSTFPIKADYLGDDIIASTLSQNKITAEGNVAGVVIQSNGKNFRFEQRLSATQYSTNLGVFEFGNTYTVNPYTFSVTPVTVNLPIPVTTENLVSLETFFSAWVKDESVYSIGLENDGELIVATDDLNLTGLSVKNPYYGATNMTVYEPYEDSGNGFIVFQFDASSSPYFTGYCYYEAKSSYDNYECELGSLSFFGSFGSIGLSFSLDEAHQDKPRNADQMAFSLF